MSLGPSPGSINSSSLLKGFEMREFCFPRILGFLLLISLSIGFASCAPFAAAAPKQTHRCIVVIGATWCQPCQALERDVIPKLKTAGLTVADFADKQKADVHILKIDKTPDPRIGWKVDHETIPCMVVFENGKIVTSESGSFDESSFYRLLQRDDLLARGKPDKHETPPAAVDAEKSTWDQILEFIGDDTATLTLTIPKGRKVAIEQANAAAYVPETLTARVKVVDNAIQIDFDKPLPRAEGTRLGIRVSTTIPEIVATKDLISVKTGIGIPFRWEMTGHPFGSE